MSSGDFTKNAVTYERLPVLFSNDVPCLVLHRSTLNDFLLKQKNATPAKNPVDCTLTDLFSAVTWLKEKSFVTVGRNATAGQARENGASQGMQRCLGDERWFSAVSNDPLVHECRSAQGRGSLN